MAGRFIILGTGIVGKTGEWDKHTYTRRLVGHPENIVSLCKKPHFTKAQRKKMAERPQVKRFVEVNAEAQAIWHDPVRKAEWEAKHKAALHDGSRHHYDVHVRLWDFIRHELNKAKKEAENGTQK